jgi:hypothetical protein
MTACTCFQECPEDFNEEDRHSPRRLRAYLEQLRSHPYWSRLWFVQEIHLAGGGPKIIAGSLLLDDAFLVVLMGGPYEF